MNGCDLMYPRFTCCVSTDRFLTLGVQCQGVADFKLAQCDISADFILYRCGMGM